MADTRQEILDHASALFASQGYEKTSLREIAEEVGVTKAALYYHFPSKQDILVALFAPVATMQEDLLVELRQDTLLDPVSWLPALEKVLDAILSNRRLFALLERNATTLTALDQQGTFAESHLELHRRTEALFADARLPLEHRVRLACAFGAIFGILEVGGSTVFGEAGAEELRPLVLEAVRDVLAPVTDAALR